MCCSFLYMPTNHNCRLSDIAQWLTSNSACSSAPSRLLVEKRADTSSTRPRIQVLVHWPASIIGARSYYAMYEKFNHIHKKYLMWTTECRSDDYIQESKEGVVRKKWSPAFHFLERGKMLRRRGVTTLKQDISQFGPTKLAYMQYLNGTLVGYHHRQRNTLLPAPFVRGYKPHPTIL